MPWLAERHALALPRGRAKICGHLCEITGPEAYETPDFKAIKGFGPFDEHVFNFQRIRLGPIEEADGAARKT